MNYTVIGRRWNDKLNGNTYHSVYVYKDGEMIGSEGFDYGYGNQYEQCALNIIKKDNPEIKANVLWRIKEEGHTLISTVSDGLKRDL